MDVDSKRLDENKLQIGDYVKPTDSGIYTNFYSNTLLQYKQSIVKALVNRTMKKQLNLTDMPHRAKQNSASNS